MASVRDQRASLEQRDVPLRGPQVSRKLPLLLRVVLAEHREEPKMLASPVQP